MQKMSPKVKSVKILEQYCMLLEFENGEEKIFNVKPYLKYDVFTPLEDKAKFEDVYIDFGTVCWRCGADLSRDTLYIKGETITQQNTVIQ